MTAVTVLMLLMFMLIIVTVSFASVMIMVMLVILSGFLLLFRVSILAVRMGQEKPVNSKED